VENCRAELYYVAAPEMKAVANKKTLAIVTRTCCDAPAEFADEVESSLIERTMRLNGYWVKGVLCGYYCYHDNLLKKFSVVRKLKLCALLWRQTY